MEHKTCSRCGQTKNVDEFGWSSRTKDQRQFWCKTCFTENSKAHYKERDLKEALAAYTRQRKNRIFRLLDHLKACNPCQFCGEGHPCSLDFHHLDPLSKEGLVSQYASRKNYTKAIAEARKCAVICRNCHSKVHTGLLNDSIVRPCVFPSDIPWDLGVIPAHQALAKNLAEQTVDVNFGKRSKRGRKDRLCQACGASLGSRRGKYCSPKCVHYATKKPSKEELEALIWTLPSTEIAKKFGVSDSAIVKWVRGYGLSKPGRGYWTSRHSRFDS
jgi:hypothetical protein